VRGSQSFSLWCRRGLDRDFPIATRTCLHTPSRYAYGLLLTHARGMQREHNVFNVAAPWPRAAGVGFLPGSVRQPPFKYFKCSSRTFMRMRVTCSFTPVNHSACVNATERNIRVTSRVGVLNTLNDKELVKKKKKKLE
jgi:hypothetical protein